MGSSTYNAWFATILNTVAAQSTATINQATGGTFATTDPIWSAQLPAIVEYAEQRIYRSHFGFPNFFVPLIAPTRVRMESMIALLQRMTGGRRHATTPRNNGGPAMSGETDFVSPKRAASGSCVLWRGTKYYVVSMSGECIGLARKADGQVETWTNDSECQPQS